MLLGSDEFGIKVVKEAGRSPWGAIGRINEDVPALRLRLTKGSEMSFPRYSHDHHKSFESGVRDVKYQAIILLVALFIGCVIINM